MIRSSFNRPLRDQLVPRLANSQKQESEEKEVLIFEKQTWEEIKATLLNLRSRSINNLDITFGSRSNIELKLSDINIWEGIKAGSIRSLFKLTIRFDAVRLTTTDIETTIKFVNQIHKLKHFKITFAFCSLPINSVGILTNQLLLLKQNSLKSLSVDLSGNPLALSNQDSHSQLTRLLSIPSHSFELKLCASNIKEFNFVHPITNLHKEDNQKTKRDTLSQPTELNYPIKKKSKKDSYCQNEMIVSEDINVHLQSDETAGAGAIEEENEQKQKDIDRQKEQKRITPRENRQNSVVLARTSQRISNHSSGLNSSITNPLGATQINTEKGTIRNINIDLSQNKASLNKFNFTRIHQTLSREFYQIDNLQLKGEIDKECSGVIITNFVLSLENTLDVLVQSTHSVYFEKTIFKNYFNLLKSIKQKSKSPSSYFQKAQFPHLLSEERGFSQETLLPNFTENLRLKFPKFRERERTELSPILQLGIEILKRQLYQMNEFGKLEKINSKKGLNKQPSYKDKVETSILGLYCYESLSIEIQVTSKETKREKYLAEQLLLEQKKIETMKQIIKSPQPEKSKSQKKKKQEIKNDPVVQNEPTTSEKPSEQLVKPTKVKQDKPPKPEKVKLTDEEKKKKKKESSDRSRAKIKEKKLQQMLKEKEELERLTQTNNLEQENSQQQPFLEKNEGENNEEIEKNIQDVVDDIECSKQKEEEIENELEAQNEHDLNKEDDQNLQQIIVPQINEEKEEEVEIKSEDPLSSKQKDTSHVENEIVKDEQPVEKEKEMVLISEDEHINDVNKAEEQKDTIMNECLKELDCQLEDSIKNKIDIKEIQLESDDLEIQFVQSIVDHDPIQEGSISVKDQQPQINTDKIIKDGLADSQEDQVLQKVSKEEFILSDLPQTTDHIEQKSEIQVKQELQEDNNNNNNTQAINEGIEKNQQIPIVEQEQITDLIKTEEIEGKLKIDIVDEVFEPKKQNEIEQFIKEALFEITRAMRIEKIYLTMRMNELSCLALADFFLKLPAYFKAKQQLNIQSFLNNIRIIESHCCIIQEKTLIIRIDDTDQLTKLHVVNLARSITQIQPDSLEMIEIQFTSAHVNQILSLSHLLTSLRQQMMFQASALRIFPSIQSFQCGLNESVINMMNDRGEYVLIEYFDNFIKQKQDEHEEIPTSLVQIKQSQKLNQKQKRSKKNMDLEQKLSGLQSPTIQKQNDPDDQNEFGQEKNIPEKLESYKSEMDFKNDINQSEDFVLEAQGNPN